MQTTTVIVSELLGSALLLAVLVCPMVGRGCGLRARRESRSAFEPHTKGAVISRADCRCESFIFLLWGGCGEDAVDVEPIYPLDKGGSALVGNGRAVCEHHRGSTSGFTPPWWYVLCLELRRRHYFPDYVDVRVRAAEPARGRASVVRWRPMLGPVPR